MIKADKGIFPYLEGKLSTGVSGVETAEALIAWVKHNKKAGIKEEILFLFIVVLLNKVVSEGPIDEASE